MLCPFAALFLLTYCVPTAFALYKSAFGVRRDGAYGTPHAVFVGLGNYGMAISDPAFRASVLRVVIYAVGPGLAVVVGGLLLALLIDARAPGRLTRFFRLVAFMPFAVPVVIGAILWGFLYAPSISPLADAARSAGLDLLSGHWIMFSVANVAVWTYVGYNMMIFLAALSALDPAIYEAAAVDGVGAWRLAWSIKLPLLRPALALCLVFHLIGTMQLFTEPLILRTISGAITSDWTPNMLAFQEAASNNYSYAAAISVLLAMLAGAFSFTLMRFLWRAP